LDICLGPYIYIDDVIYDILPILIIPLIISYIKPNLPYLRYKSLNYQIFDKYYKQNAFLNNLYLLKMVIVVTNLISLMSLHYFFDLVKLNDQVRHLNLIIQLLD
jgi:hypothetical protein